MDDLDLLISLCETIKETSLCGLGMTAPNPVLSTHQVLPQRVHRAYCA